MKVKSVAEAALAAVMSAMVGLLCEHVEAAESQLPEGYTPLEYIQSTGQQHINTEVIPSEKAIFETEVDIPDAKVSDDRMIFGAWCTDGRQCRVGYNRANGKTVFYRANTGASVSTAFPAAGRKTKVRVEGKTVTLSTAGETVLSYTLNTENAVTACKHPMYLFGLNGGSGSAAGDSSMRSICKMYSFKIWDGTDLKLTRNFVPCRNESGEVGMYDLVGKKFHGNGMTGGPFIPGYGVVGALPQGFRRLSYVKATGSQHVNTGLILSENAEAEVVADVPNDATADQVLFGAWNAGDNRQFRFNVNRGGTKTVFWRANSSVTLGGFPAEGNPARVHASGKTVTVSTFAGGTVLQGTISASTAVVACRNPMYLFALDNTSDWIPGGTLMRATASIYSFKAWDKDGATGEQTLVADFVPCQAPDGEIGFYDQVGGGFHGNAATDGSVLTGNATSLPADYTPLSFVEATGKQYVDTKLILGANAAVETVVEVPACAQADQTLFGAWCTSNDHQFRVNVNRGQTQTVFRRANFSVNLGGFPAEGVKARILVEGKTATVSSFDSGEVLLQKTLGTANPIVACRHPMYLFGLNNGSGAASGGVLMPATARMYSFKAWDAFDADETPLPIGDFAPCQNANGETGFYDLVKGRFHGNAATDGSVLLPGYLRLPEGYAVVDYIESTGTQYINTGMTPGANAVIETVVDVPDDKIDGDRMLFGAWCESPAGVESKQFRVGYNRVNGTTVFFRANTGTSVATDFPAGGQKATVRVEGKTVTVSTADGTVLSHTLNTQNAVTACRQPMYLFGLNNGGDGVSGNPSMLGSFRMYSFKVWDKVGTSNDLTMTGDFVPCSNGSAYGMYDRVNGRFYPNAATGDDFNAGETSFWYEGDVLHLRGGVLTDAWITGLCSKIEKSGTGTAAVGDVTEIPALTLSAGEFSLKNGRLDTLSVTGTFAVSGGAVIGIDLDKSNGCDRIDVGAVDLSQASAANPIVLAVRKIPGVWKDRYLVLSGGSLAADDAAKFAVSSRYLTSEVIDGNLYLVPINTGFSLILR